VRKCLLELSHTNVLKQPPPHRNALPHDDIYINSSWLRPVQRGPVYHGGLRVCLHPTTSSNSSANTFDLVVPQPRGRSASTRFGGGNGCAREQREGIARAKRTANREAKRQGKKKTLWGLHAANSRRHRVPPTGRTPIRTPLGHSHPTSASYIKDCLNPSDSPSSAPRPGDDQPRLVDSFVGRRNAVTREQGKIRTL
jgi:hypothetical protein